MRYAVGLPTVGQFGDAMFLRDLAVAAERHGWDGVRTGRGPTCDDWG